MKKMQFMEFVCKNPQKDDSDMHGEINDGVWTNNLQRYFDAYMIEHGKRILFDFWNHRSDACPLESEIHDNQLIAFEKYIKEQFGKPEALAVSKN